MALRVAEQLSRNYYSAYEEIRTLGLASFAPENSLLLHGHLRKHMYPGNDTPLDDYTQTSEARR